MDASHVSPTVKMAGPLSRFIPPTDVSIFLFLLLLTLGLSAHPFVFEDPDTAWHLAAGDLMRAKHAFINTDPWSFTAGDARWYNLSWLFDLLLSFTVSAWGVGAVFGLTLVVYAGCLALMAHHCLLRGSGLLATCLILALSTFLMFPAVIARPQMCSEVLTILFYHQLHRYRASGRAAHLAILMPMMALWVNLHGGFIVAFPLIGLFLAEAKYRGYPERVRTLNLTLAACAAATCLNPYGFDIYTGVYKTLFSTFGQVSIREWQPVKIGRSIPFLILLMVLLCTGPMFDRRTPRIEDTLAIALFITTLRSVRYVAISSLLMMPYLSLRLTLRLADSRWGKRIAETEALLFPPMQRQDVRLKAAVIALSVCIGLCTPYPRIALLLAPFIGMQVLAMLTMLNAPTRVSILQAMPKPLPTRIALPGLMVVFTFYFLYPRQMLLEHFTGFPERYMPTSEAVFVAARYPDLRFYNDYDIGGYLIYLWRGNFKVFVDGRANSVYSEELLNDHINFRDSGGLSERAKQIAGKYELDGAIIANVDPSIVLWNSNPEWKPVFKGKIATVYVRLGHLPAESP